MTRGKSDARGPSSFGTWTRMIEQNTHNERERRHTWTTHALRSHLPLPTTATGNRIRTKKKAPSPSAAPKNENETKQSNQDTNPTQHSFWIDHSPTLFWKSPPPCPIAHHHPMDTKSPQPISPFFTHTHTPVRISIFVHSEENSATRTLPPTLHHIRDLRRGVPWTATCAGFSGSVKRQC